MASPASKLTQLLKTLWKRRAMIGVLVLYTVACVIMTRRMEQKGAQVAQRGRTASAEDRGLDGRLSSLHTFSESLSAGYPAEKLGDTSRRSSGDIWGAEGAESGTCPMPMADVDLTEG